MHAGTEQLLTIRDGGLIDAATAQHVEHCDACREQLTELRQTREALRALPELEAPAGGWARIAASLERPTSNTQWWAVGVAAAAAFFAIAVWRFAGAPESPTTVGQVAMNTAGPVIDADTPQLAELVSQSRRLEQLLRDLDANTPRVMNAGTAGTIAGLQDGIAYIDYGLSLDDDRLSQAQSEQLWRQRVGLMNTLVQVRGAQLQPVSNERR